MYDIKAYKGNAKELIDHREDYSEEAIWTNSSFSGMPGYQISVNYDMPIKKAVSILGLGLPNPMRYFFIGMICFFILGLSLKMKWYVALFGSVAFGLTSFHFVITEAGHTSKMLAISIFPAVLAFFILVYRSKGVKLLLFGALFSLFFALDLVANHIQMTYYLSFILVGIGIYYFIKSYQSKELTRFFKQTGIIFIGLMIAVLCNFSNYYFTYSYAQNSVRGKQHLTLTADKKPVEKKESTKGLPREDIVYYSYGIGETYNFLVPLSKGASFLEKELYEKVPEAKTEKVKGYWGALPESGGPNYLGSIIVLLALLYLVLIHEPLKWVLLAITLIALGLAWGRNLGGINGMWLSDLFIYYIPLYSKFRAVATVLVVVNLLVPLMAILFLNRIISNKTKVQITPKKILWISGIVIGFIGFNALFPDLLFDLFSRSEGGLVKNASKSDLVEKVKLFRASIFRGDSLKTMLFLILGSIILVLLIKEKIKALYGVLILLTLVIIDKSFINYRIINNTLDQNDQYVFWEKGDVYSNVYTAQKGDLEILAIETNKNPKLKDSIRNIQSKNIFEKDALIFKILKKNTHYRVINIDKPFTNSDGAAVSYFHKSSGGYNPAILRRYQNVIDFYLKTEIDSIRIGKVEKAHIFNMLNNKYYLAGDSLYAVNNDAFGNAWFVDSIRWVTSDDQEILALGNIRDKETAVLNSTLKKQAKQTIKKDSLSRIELISAKANELVYETENNYDGLAVFSEVYYPQGWNSYIDGKQVDYTRANYFLRGLFIPKGTHKVTFKFEPSMFKLANYINVISFWIMVLFILIPTFLLLRKKNSSL